MSLFGARKLITSIRDRIARMDRMEEEIIAGKNEEKFEDAMEPGVYTDSVGTATTSEIAHEGREEHEGGLSPPQSITTDYGESITAFPPSANPASQTTDYGESIAAFPPSAIPVSQEENRQPVRPSSVMTCDEGRIYDSPWSATPVPPGNNTTRSFTVSRFLESGEKIENKKAENEEGVLETLKRNSTIDDDENESEVATEVDWREDEPYMTPTMPGKKRNKGKGVKRPESPERPIPNMPQTPSRRKLEADWAKPAEVVTNKEGAINLEAFVGEYLRNTNGLRDFMATNQLHDE
jgi:hypothetical protein